MQILIDYTEYQIVKNCAFKFTFIIIEHCLMGFKAKISQTSENIDKLFRNVFYKF